MKIEKKEFEYVYVEEDSTVRELEKEEIDYLNAEFEPTDGARPYIKNSYSQLTPNNKVRGFIQRIKVPENIIIKQASSRYLEIRSSINVYDSGRIIELSTGIYSVKILGGWNVSVENFTFSLKNIENNNIFNPKVANWRVQSYELGKKAKKIMILDITERGKYIIEFKNQENLKVKPSNLPFTSLFEKQIPNTNLEIWIG